MAAVNAPSNVAASTTSAAPFSYAQAAKGKSPAIKAVDAKSDAPTDSPTLKATMETSLNWADDSNTLVEAQDSPAMPTPPSKTQDVEPHAEPTVTPDDVKKTDAEPTSTIESRPQSSIKDDARSPSASAPSELSWRRRPQQESEPASGSASDAGSQKGERKDKIKERSHFVDAPAPVVNIWAKRASDAKVKPPPPAAAPVVSSEKPKSVPHETSNTKATNVSKPQTESAKDRRSEDRSARGGRSSEPTVSRARVPSMDDAGLWPTPETSKDDERRKSQPLTKHDSAQPVSDAAKPHGKQDWKKIDFTPSVKFETQMPVRGRGRGGSRGGGRGAYLAASGRGSGSDEVSVTSNPRPEPHNAAKSSQNGPRPRKSADEASRPTHSARPVETDASVAAPPDSDRVSPKSNTVPQDANTATTTAAAAADVASRRKPSKTAEPESVPSKPAEVISAERKRGNSLNGHPPKMASTDRRPEKPSDAGLPFARGDGRPERGGRGGKRGGFYNGGSHAAAASFQPNGGAAPGFFSPKNAQFQNGFPNTGTFSPTRNGRSGGQRNSSYPSDNMSYGQSMNAFPSVPGMSPAFPPYYGYGGPGPVSQQGYQEHQAQIALLNGISHQLSYYFSFENLIKDMFLRAHMTSNGYVPLKFVAEFQRMKYLTQDMNIIRTVAMQSPEFIVRVDVEGNSHIRRRHDWDQFVLDMDARKPSAQNEGPTFADEVPPTPYYDHQNPRSPADAMFQPMQAPPQVFTQFSPVNAGSPVNGFPRSPPGPFPMSTIDGHFEYSRPPQQPTLFLSEQAREATAPEDEPDDFRDEKLDQLHVVVRPRGTSSTMSRVNSNGQTNGDHLSAPNGDSKTEDNANGTHKRDHSARIADIKKTLTSPPSAHKSTLSTSSTSDAISFVLKEKSEEPSALPPNSSYEPYGQICANAIHQRQNAPRGECPYEMRLLYDFWLHFLQRNFNTRMYTDFKVMAHEDASRESKDGLQSLLKFYSESMLSSTRTIRPQVARDFVGLVAHEDRSEERLGFKQMRQVLRNGALNLKSRRTIKDLTSGELWEELDR